MTTQELINIGALPNDGQGDPLRVAFAKINNNFTSLFSTTADTSSIYTLTGAANQVIYESVVTQFTQATYQIRTSSPGTPDCQGITISAQLLNNLNGVRFSAYATTFNGTPLTRYDMDVSSGNVRVMVSPLANQMLFHFIAAQITYTGDDVPGVDLSLDGYVPDSLMTTEGNLIVTTEGT